MKFITRLSFICFLAGLMDGTSALRAENVTPPGTNATEAISPPKDLSPLSKARQLLKDGRPRKARRNAKAYLKKHKKSPEAWVVLAQTYAATESQGKAMRRYKKALKYDPHYAPAYMGRGQLYEKKGRLDEAMNEYRAASLADPNNLKAKEAWERLSDRLVPKE